MSDHRPHNQDQGTNRPLAELLSAYLDDRESLASAELEQVELLLEQDRDVQQAYAELRVISRGLGNLEPISAPRSYHLDAEMVGSPEPVVLQKSSAWYTRHTATVRWATAAAAMLFVFVLSADLVLNNVLSDPNRDTNDAFNVEQAEVTGRNADSDDADAAAGDDAMEESSGADADGGAAAPPVVTPEVVEDAGESAAAIQQGDAEEEAEDEAASTLDSSAVESNPGDEDQAADAAESESGDGSNADASDESASNDQMIKFDEAETGAGDGDSGRRLWRIAEFSLAVLLGLLITAMVILPRLGSGSARARGE